MVKISQEKRLAVRQIIVDQWEAPQKTKIPYRRNNVRAHNGHPTKKKKRESIARKFLDEYLKDSSVHGVKYLGNFEIRLSIIEKIFWTVIMICSFVFLFWMAVQIWARYKDDTVRTVIENFYAPISLIPFPAVTLCPLIPPLVERRRMLLERMRLPHGIDNNTAMFLFKYGPAFTSEHVPGGKEHVNKLKTLLKFNHMSLADMLRFLRPCEDIVHSCWWNGERMNCSTMFKSSFTFQGLCCSFNYHLEDYNGMRLEDFESFFRTASFGSMNGLAVVLHPNLLVENDGTGEITRYSTNSIGILVFSHHPFEFLGPVSGRHLLQSKFELRIAVQPKVNKKLAGYYRRDVNNELIPHCVDNLKLKYLPVPLYSNCFIDCSIEASLRICDCVPFYYEPVATKYSLRICDWDDFECLYINADNIRIIKNTRNNNFTCQCLSPCINLHYETETSIGILNRQNCNVMRIHQNLTEAQAIVKVYMDSETFTITGSIPVADELYLLASVGGIFSLFVGCSFISAIEIFYFVGLFLRSYCNSK